MAKSFCPTLTDATGQPQGSPVALCCPGARSTDGAREPARRAVTADNADNAARFASVIASTALLALVPLTGFTLALAGRGHCRMAAVHTAAGVRQEPAGTGVKAGGAVRLED